MARQPPPDERGRPFPPNKSFTFRLVCPPPRSPIGYWRPAAAQSYCPGKGKLVGSIRVASAPPPQIESEIRQSRGCGESGHPSQPPPSPPGSMSPWSSPTLFPDSWTDMGSPLSYTHTLTHVPLHTSTGAPMLCTGHTHARTHFPIRIKFLKSPKPTPLNPPSPRNDNRDGSRDR